MSLVKLVSRPFSSHFFNLDIPTAVGFLVWYYLIISGWDASDPGLLGFVQLLGYVRFFAISRCFWMPLAYVAFNGSFPTPRLAFLLIIATTVPVLAFGA